MVARPLITTPLTRPAWSTDTAVGSLLFQLTPVVSSADWPASSVPVTWACTKSPRRMVDGRPTTTLFTLGPPPPTPATSAIFEHARTATLATSIARQRLLDTNLPWQEGTAGPQ